MSAATATGASGAYGRPEPRRKTQRTQQTQRTLMSAAERSAHIETNIERWTRHTLAQIAQSTTYEQQAREAQWRAFWSALRARALSGAMAPDKTPTKRQRAWAEPDVCSDAADELAYTDDTDDTDDSERDEED